MNSDDDHDEGALFREAMKGVQPRRPSDRLAPPRRPLAPRPLQREADDRAVLREMLEDPDPETYESGDTLAYRTEGVQDAVFRRLRRGGYRVEAELDLHGMTAATARDAVAQFLAGCHDRDQRCVRIIHGKGLRSPNSGPVLKTRVDGWLRKRKDVLAFTSARPQDGGTGAIYVLLKRPSRR